MTPEDSEEETYPAITGIFHRSFFLVCTMPWAQPKTSNNRKWSCLWQICGRSTLGHIFKHLWTLWHSLVELVTEDSAIWHWCLSAGIPRGPCLQILTSLPPSPVSVPQNHTPSGGNETKTKTEDRELTFLLRKIIQSSETDAFSFISLMWQVPLDLGFSEGLMWEETFTISLMTMGSLWMQEKKDISDNE